MLGYAMLCYAMLCYAIRYYTLLYYDILYYTMLCTMYHDLVGGWDHRPWTVYTYVWYIVVSDPCMSAIPACFWSKVVKVLISASDCDKKG